MAVRRNTLKGKPMAENNEQIVIVGAGAIGRGFLPWLFKPGRYEFIFVDKNKKLVCELNRARGYTTCRIKNGMPEKRKIPVSRAYTNEEFNIDICKNPVAVFVGVGPRNSKEATKNLGKVKCPIILCENDPATVADVKQVLPEAKVYFAIPDVITSNTASKADLAIDPLTINTEDGVLHVDERAAGIEGDISFCPEEELINKHWTAKLFLHNTPHCIAAYLGALIGVKYVHEAMQCGQINEIVNGAMNEMLTALKLKWVIPHDFLEWYAGKEIRRFSNTLLFDPVSRVSREPLRKLNVEGRLIGAAQICLAQGFVPNNILKGIVSAIIFDNEEDADRPLLYMQKIFHPSILLTYIIGLRKGEVLEIVLEEQFASIVESLEKLVAESKKAET